MSAVAKHKKGPTAGVGVALQQSCKQEYGHIWTNCLKALSWQQSALCFIASFTHDYNNKYGLESSKYAKIITWCGCGKCFGTLDWNEARPHRRASLKPSAAAVWSCELTFYDGLCRVLMACLRGCCSPTCPVCWCFRESRYPLIITAKVELSANVTY